MNCPQCKFPMKRTTDTLGGGKLFACDRHDQFVFAYGGAGEYAPFDSWAHKVEEQPKPKANSLPAVWDLVIEDMKRRDGVGRERYGVPLQPFNGRDTLRDAYEEALDLAVYLRALIYERESGK